MFQVLIAEDSKPILRNLKSLLEASGLPVQVAGTAANGEEALEFCRSHPIDILLTDIRMPKMDGLALIDHAKKLNGKLKAVLISGYNDFEYTRKALNLQVCDYLLKPIERSQLIDVVERIVEQLKEERYAGHSVLEALLEQATGSKLNADPSFWEQPKLICVVRKAIFTPQDEQWEAEVLQEKLVSVFGGQLYQVFPAQDPRQMLILLDASFKKACPSFQEQMKQLHHLLAELSLPASVGCSSRPCEPAFMLETYNQISQLLRERETLNSPVLLDLHHIAPASAPAIDRETIDRLEDSYADMVRRMQKDRFLLHLSEQLNKWQRNNISIAMLERIVNRLSGAFDSSAAQLGGRQEWNMMDGAQGLLSASSYAEFSSRLLAYSSQCFDILLSQNKKSANELFDRIDEFLRMNLYAQVTMNDLSEKFHVSSSYISRVVKRYSKNTFVHYYLDMKIREARRLMENNPDMKIKEISDALCFHDQHYFSKVFKEFAGCSPTEYKTAKKPGS